MLCEHSYDGVTEEHQAHLEDALSIHRSARGLSLLSSLREVDCQLVAVLNGHAASLPQVGLHGVGAVAQQSNQALRETQHLCFCCFSEGEEHACFWSNDHIQWR